MGNSASEINAETGNFILAANRNFIRRDLGEFVASKGGEILFSHEGAGFALISGISEEEAIELAGINGVSLVEAEVEIQLESIKTDGVHDAQISDLGIMNDNPETAFFFARQWHLNAISAPDAWAAGKTGSSDVTVAILDTGIDYTYPDLAGLVDLDRSVSFIPGDDAIVNVIFPGAHPIADLHYHGTHVAATVSSNALAAAGVTSKTTLMGVKVCNVNGSCPTGAVLAGMLYAADNGADIANMSLGGLFLKSANPGFVSLINNVTNYVRQQGTLIVVAAGNSAVDLNRNIVPVEGGSLRAPSLFASYCDAPGVFCVSATGPEATAGVNGPWQNIDAVAPYTNFGSAINAAAPGGFASPVWAGCSTFSLQIPQCQTGAFILGLSGTSMASPHAAGVAALIKADTPRINPAQLSRELERASDKIDGNGRSPFYGQGRVNAATAVGL
ncbi:S8 family serine peptidase [Rhodohalobacter sp. SW132]|uniref:S8 family serine peptidase n=1 Tax=Rhodohalobacter sp. SW132 TaxID=2293433 RepID=UPI0013153696|nr:S8 family serine peptidase [Rhodohalobacter sp. SW132]